MKELTHSIIADDQIIKKIYFIRGHKVMFDADLAALYGVETKQLKRQVNRNIRRFPEDFMFELTQEEISWCQIGTLKQGGNIKYRPYVFTEQGVVMLSGILNSDRAIDVNIQIMRVFTRVRQMLYDNTELRLAIEEIRKKTENNSKNIELVFQYLDELIEKKENQSPPQKIGFRTEKP